MFDFLENIKAYVIGAIVIAGIILLSIYCGSDSASPSSDKPRNTERRIATAKAELDKIKTERSKDGSPGKLSVFDVTKPEVVLPPVLALLEDELDYYGIDRTKLSEEIKANPDAFRKAVPEHWRKRFLILTQEHEKLVGDKLDTELADSGKIYHDAKAMARVQKIVNKLSMQMPEKQALKIFLYKDDSINAFCLPNGSVYVHSGLLMKVTDDNVLAFVLAHELAHIAARHGNESASKHIFLMAGDVLAEDKAKKLTQTGKAGKGLLLRASYIGGGIVGTNLPFRRKMENEADTLGIRYMARAGYDPQAAVKFWEEFGNINAQDPIWLKFLSTHPIDKKRYERMQKECEKLIKKKKR